jgi:transcriptional regulator with XRE-family HTH domain
MCLRQAHGEHNLLIMITPVQSKMARAALGWGLRDFAKKANVGLSTIARFEGGSGNPTSSTLTAMKLTLESAGITFIDKGVIFDPPSDVPLEAIKQQEEQKAPTQPMDAGKVKEEAASIDKGVTLDPPPSPEQD